jgi:hypothetical protein
VHGTIGPCEHTGRVISGRNSVLTTEYIIFQQNHPVNCMERHLNKDKMNQPKPVTCTEIIMLQININYDYSYQDHIACIYTFIKYNWHHGRIVLSWYV